jgi:hypothetical protein
MEDDAGMPVIMECRPMAIYGLNVVIMKLDYRKLQVAQVSTG